ncbi:MAG: gfo/Idh/MocA family oxidoreductase, partial [Pseudomonadota bacterium]
ALPISPWSWELTARENPVYPRTGESCYLIGGTHGSLSLPDLRLWQNGGDRGWWEPLSATSLPHDHADPLVEQISHFSAVIAGAEPPLVSGEEGLESLRVLEAIQVSAVTGAAVEL